MLCVDFKCALKNSGACFWVNLEGCAGGVRADGLMLQAGQWAASCDDSSSVSAQLWPYQGALGPALDLRNLL